MAAAIRMGSVSLKAPRINGRVKFSSDAKRVVEIYDACMDATTTSAEARVFCSESGSLLFKLCGDNKSSGYDGLYIWSDDTIKWLALSIWGEALELHDVLEGEIAWRLPGRSDGLCLSTMMSFSPCGRFLFETNSSFGDRASMTAASVVGVKTGAVLLSFPGGEYLGPSWPYMEKGAFWGSGQFDSGQNPPPWGTKMDPVWSASGLSGAFTISNSLGTQGNSLLPGLARANGEIDAQWGRVDGRVAAIWQNLTEDNHRDDPDSSRAGVISNYLPPYTMALTSVDYSAEGSVVLSSSQDGSLRLNDARSGRHIRQFSFLGELDSAFLSPDGDRIIAWARSRQVSVLSSESGEQILRIQVGAASSISASVSAVTNQLALILPDGSLSLRSLVSGEEAGSWRSDRGSAIFARYVLDGTALVVTGNGWTTSLDAETLEVTHCRNGTLLDFCDHGSLAVIQDDDYLRLQCLASEEVLWKVRKGFSHARFSSCGSYLICTQTDSSHVTFFEVATGLSRIDKPRECFLAKKLTDGVELSLVPLEELDNLGRGPSDARAGQLCELVSSTQATGSSMVIASRTDSDEATTAADFSPDATELLIACIDELRDDAPRTWVDLIDTKDGSTRRLFDLHNPSVVTADMSCDGDRVITVDDGTDVRVWSSRTGRVEGYLSAQSGGRATFGEFSADGRVVWTTKSNSSYNLIEEILWDAETGTVLERNVSGEGGWREHREIAQAIYENVRVDEGEAFIAIEASSRKISPDGSRVATSQNGSASLWDGATGEIISPLPILFREACDFEFSRDGARLLVIPDAGPPIVLDALTGTMLCECLGHHDQVMSAKFSPAEDCFVVIYESGRARLWGERTNGLAVELGPVTSPIQACAFACDSGLIAAHLLEGSVAVFDTNSAHFVLKILSEEGPIDAFTFTPDGCVRTIAGLAIETWDTSCANAEE